MRSAYEVTETRRSSRKLKLLKPALYELHDQAQRTKDLEPVEGDEHRSGQPDEALREVRFVFLNSHPGRISDLDQTAQRLVASAPDTGMGAAPRAKSLPTCLRQPNCAVPIDWITAQPGHTTAMILRLYGW